MNINILLYFLIFLTVPRLWWKSQLHCPCRPPNPAHHHTGLEHIAHKIKTKSNIGLFRCNFSLYRPVHNAVIWTNYKMWPYSYPYYLIKAVVSTVFCHSLILIFDIIQFCFYLSRFAGTSSLCHDRLYQCARLAEGWTRGCLEGSWCLLSGCWVCLCRVWMTISWRRWWMGITTVHC